MPRSGGHPLQTKNSGVRKEGVHIDAMVAQKSMVEKKSMSVGWIGFQKAYDRVPHQWLKDMLRR